MKTSFKHLILLTLFSVIGIGAAVYAYTGPNRTRTEPVITCKIVLWECQYIESKARYSYHQIDDWSCSNESKPWQAYPSSGPACSSYTLREKYWSREERVEEIPVTYPSAEISAQPLCSLPGQNGWCRSGAVLQLSGYEPVAGYAISAIEGLRGGENFALAGQTVNVAAVEGQNNFEYWAHSTFGDTSLKGASTLYLDSQPPTLNVELNGSSGSNAWLKSVTLSASANDPSPGSGLGGLAYTLDGSNWIGLSSPASLPDGTHNLQVRASDLAGNTGLSQASEIKIDSLAPTLNVSESGTGGANDWYISTVQVSAAAQDGGSGLAALDVSLNGSAWTVYLVPIPLADGSHSLSFWAEDMAGWVSQDERQIRVDTQAPTIGGQISGTSGTNGWYTTNVTVTALASDPAPASGIEAFAYALNGSPDQAYSAPLALTDGQHNLILSARDQAGLETNETLTIRVDTIAPALEITSQYPEWVKDSISLAGTASDGGSGLARIEASFDGGKTWQLASGTSAWSIAYDTRQATSGRQTWYIRAVDLAGQDSLRSVGVPIDNTPPRIDLPGSWNLWETVTFDAWDGDSGLANAELVISDPQNRWPKRVYSYQLGHLPLSFQWDRRLGDGTLAPLGDYDVSATATDRMGNTRKVTASISISLGEVILFPPTATPLGTPRPTATPTITPQQTTETAILFASPTPTSGSGGMAFGATAQPGQPSPATPASSAPPRATPTESPFSSWIGSLFTPSAAAAVDSQAESSDGILWGAGALAAIAGMTAYYEQKRREEEEAKRAAVQSQFAAEQAEKERQQKAQAKAMAKLEQQWAEERRKEQAYLQWKAEQEQSPESHRGQDGKLEREENKEEAAWEAWKDRSQLLAAQRAEDAASLLGKRKIQASITPNHDIPMPPGLNPEEQMAFLHSPQAAKWIADKSIWLSEWQDKCLPVLLPQGNVTFKTLPPGDAAKYGRDFQNRYFNFSEFIRSNSKYGILPAKNPWWHDNNLIPSYIYNNPLFPKILPLALLYERELGVVWNKEIFKGANYEEYRNAYQEAEARKLFESMKEYGPDAGYYYFLGGRQSTYFSQENPAGLAYAKNWPTLDNEKRFNYALKSVYEVFYPSTIDNISWCEGNQPNTPNDWGDIMKDELEEKKNKLLKDAFGKPPGSDRDRIYAYYESTSNGEPVYLFVMTTNQIETLCPGRLNCVR